MYMYTKECDCVCVRHTLLGHVSPGALITRDGIFGPVTAYYIKISGGILALFPGSPLHTHMKLCKGHDILGKLISVGFVKWLCPL